MITYKHNRKRDLFLTLSKQGCFQRLLKSAKLGSNPDYLA